MRGVGRLGRLRRFKRFVRFEMFNEFNKFKRLEVFSATAFWFLRMSFLCALAPVSKPVFTRDFNFRLNLKNV